MRFQSKKSIVLAIVISILLVVTIVGDSCTQVPPEQEEYYLTGNLEDVTGTILTDEGEEIATRFSGMIGFRVVSEPEGELAIIINSLNLVTEEGVPTRRGDSGVIGLALATPEYETTYDPSTGRITTEFRSTLHYELIDQIKGYRQLEREEEQDVFPSYTEEMVGNLNGRMPENLRAEVGENIELEYNIEWIIDSPVLNSVQKIIVTGMARIIWELTHARALRIQPVLIGTGPLDPHTGTAFNDLMAGANELWDKCGTVRCLHFVVNSPIYLNKPEYKVLDNKEEINNLRNEVDVANAVEVFVVERWSESLTCDTGGGSCSSSGTASAKIVTSDQQLSVPCPCPCTGGCPCGGCGVDPSTCGAVNLYHLAHELGHALDLGHPSKDPLSTAGSIMEPSGFCCDNPNVQSAKNCRNAASPLLYWIPRPSADCSGVPDIMN